MIDNPSVDTTHAKIKRITICFLYKEGKSKAAEENKIKGLYTEYEKSLII